MTSRSVVLRAIAKTKCSNQRRVIQSSGRCTQHRYSIPRKNLCVTKWSLSNQDENGKFFSWDPIKCRDPSATIDPFAKYREKKKLNATSYVLKEMQEFFLQQRDIWIANLATAAILPVQKTATCSANEIYEWRLSNHMTWAFSDQPNFLSITSALCISSRRVPGCEQMFSRRMPQVCGAMTHTIASCHGDAN